MACTYGLTDYGFYVSEFCGDKIADDDFFKYASKAEDYVRGMTGINLDSLSGNQLRLAKKAICAIAEMMQDEARVSSRVFSPEKTVSSETVGKHSVSYGSQSLSSSDLKYMGDRKREILQMYLGSLMKARSYPCTHRTL